MLMGAQRTSPMTHRFGLVPLEKQKIESPRATMDFLSFQTVHCEPPFHSRHNKSPPRNFPGLSPNGAHALSPVTEGTRLDLCIVYEST